MTDIAIWPGLYFFPLLCILSKVTSHYSRCGTYPSPTLHTRSEIFLISTAEKSTQRQISSLDWNVVSLRRISWWSLSWPRNSPPLMDAKVWLLCSQQSATGDYPEPDESSPHYFLTIHFNIILPCASRSPKRHKSGATAPSITSHHTRRSSLPQA
jgi:hypothetical protein